MKKVLIITGDGGESYEAWYAVHRLQEAGYTPVVAAPSARRLHLVMHDFEPGWDTYIERQGYGMEAQISYRGEKPDDYDAVLLLGGRAPEYLRNDQQLLELVRAFDNARKWIFAICHGVQILVTAGVTIDKCVTCYEHVRSEVELTGGTWGEPQAVRDGRIVTAQTWQSHPEFYREVFACLNGERADAARS